MIHCEEAAACLVGPAGDCSGHLFCRFSLKDKDLGKHFQNAQTDY